ncbi:MAG: hypothetical protein ACRD0F_08770, partial [Acidimicrobiales bacterium]
MARYSGFIAPPGEVDDWRLIVLVEAAAAAGLLGALPGTPGEVAAGLGLDADSVRVALDALGTFDVVQG